MVTSNRDFPRTEEQIKRYQSKNYKKLSVASSLKKFSVDNEEFQALDKGYLAHHFKCMTCIAAGRGIQYGNRCDLGTMLWEAYSDL